MQASRGRDPGVVSGAFEGTGCRLGTLPYYDNVGDTRRPRAFQHLIYIGRKLLGAKVAMAIDEHVEGSAGETGALPAPVLRVAHPLAPTGSLRVVAGLAAMVLTPRASAPGHLCSMAISTGLAM